MTINTVALEEEYATLISECRDDGADAVEVDWELLETSLVQNAEWTPRGAHTLIQLARVYGAFMLRNAFALATALEIEDGDAGF